MQAFVICVMFKELFKRRWDFVIIDQVDFVRISSAICICVGNCCAQRLYTLRQHELGGQANRFGERRLLAAEGEKPLFHLIVGVFSKRTDNAKLLNGIITA